MAAVPLVVVGASAGGVEALSQLVRGLPADLPAAVLVVLHVSPDAPDVLPRILAGAGGSLPVRPATDGEPIRTGYVYVAPPDAHLLVADERLAVVGGPRENGHRPAIDPLFRSAAHAHGPRVIGVVLTGNLDDGAAGLAAIKAAGGMAVVQAPDEAPFPSMPRAAIARVAADQVLPIAEIGPALERMIKSQRETPIPPRDPLMPQHDAGGAPRPVDPPIDQVAFDSTLFPNAGARTNEALGGRPSGYACPDCRGVLWEIPEGAHVRYRCRVGHAYGVGAVMQAQAAGVETALWTALVTLEEHAALLHRMAERAEMAGRASSARSFAERAQVYLERARVVRQLVVTLPGGPADVGVDEPVSGS